MLGYQATSGTKRRTRILQPNLNIGQKVDKYENEADFVAEREISTPYPDFGIQRKCLACEEEELEMNPTQEEAIQMRQNEFENLQMHPNDIVYSSQPIIQSTGVQPVIQRYKNPFYWCDALIRLVEFEEKHGMLNTLVEYHSLNKGNLVPLNYNIPSIYGEVDVDWMLRLAVIQYPFLLGPYHEYRGLIFSRLAYLFLKSFWITVDPRTDNWNWDSILEEGNWNSANVIVKWLHGDETLRDIFAPAIPLCEGQPIGKPDLRKPTY